MTDSRGDWCVQVVNLVQGLIGCAYGFVPVEVIAATAADLRPPEQPYEDVFIRGLVFRSVTRKMQTLSKAERVLLTELVEDVSRTSKANIRKIVADLRTLLGIRGVGMAEQILDIIDGRYASKLTAPVLSRALKVSVKEAKSAFGSRFGLDISDYITRRRVDEGLQLVRSGVSVEAAAMNVGYKSKRHFYSAVRKLTGTTRRGSEIDGHRHRCRGGANVGQIRHELKN